MTKDEALRMALEALKGLINGEPDCVSTGLDAIDDIRQALDQLPDTTKMMGLIASEWAGLDEPPNSTTDVVESESTQSQELSVKKFDMEYTILRLQELADYRLKLLTKMPSEWVGLTDEEIDHIWGITPPDYVDKFALPRMIEAKLKGKNT